MHYKVIGREGEVFLNPSSTHPELLQIIPKYIEAVYKVKPTQCKSRVIFPST
jgi:hypothetical protein